MKKYLLYSSGENSRQQGKPAFSHSPTPLFPLPQCLLFPLRVPLSPAGPHQPLCSLSVRCSGAPNLANSTQHSALQCTNCTVSPLVPKARCPQAGHKLHDCSRWPCQKALMHCCSCLHVKILDRAASFSLPFGAQEAWGKYSLAPGETSVCTVDSPLCKVPWDLENSRKHDSGHRSSCIP